MMLIHVVIITANFHVSYKDNSLANQTSVMTKEEGTIKLKI